MKGRGSRLHCHAPRSELFFAQLLECRTRYDRDLESNMNAWICVKTRNRDLGSGLKYMNPTLGCKDIRCMEHRLSLLVVLFLFNCLYVYVPLDRH